MTYVQQYTEVMKYILEKYLKKNIDLAATPFTKSPKLSKSLCVIFANKAATQLYFDMFIIRIK